jgi:hypothetical protein
MTTLFERLAKNRPPAVEEKTKRGEDPAQRMLDWLQRWSKPTISVRDIHIYGPKSIRDRKSMIDAAETLVKNGWLTPAKTHRYDMRAWQIVRRPPVISPKVEM